MRPDWSRLTPDQALQGFEDLYIPRRAGGDRLAVLVRAGLTPMMVAGPRGSGRSTELNRAGVVLSAAGVRVFSFQLQELWDGPEISGRRVLFGLAERLIDRTVDAESAFIPPQGLISDLRASDPLFPRGHGKRRSPLELVEESVSEVAGFYGSGRLAVFVDGIDELVPELGREVIRALHEASELIHLVMVVSPSLVQGHDSEPVLSRVRLFPIQTAPVQEVEGLDGAKGRDFLIQVALRRLGVEHPPEDLLALLDLVARYSGGLPRSFLRLLRDAGLYASIEHQRLPSTEDLHDALRDHTEGLRRLLEAGDLEALDGARGTTGLGVPLSRRVRFLAHGLMLEHARGPEVVVLPNPLLEPLIASELGLGREE